MTRNRTITSLIIASLFALISSQAMASGFGLVDESIKNTNTNLNTNTNKNDNTNIVGVGVAVGVGVSNRINNESRAAAANYVKTGNTSAAATNAGNTLTINEAPIPANTRVEQAGKVEVRSVPNVLTGSVYPTAPCMGSSQVGGAGVGFGFSVGSSWKDDECGKRETARSFQNLGLNTDAIAVLCTSEYAAAAPSCKTQ